MIRCCLISISFLSTPLKSSRISLEKNSKSTFVNSLLSIRKVLLSLIKSGTISKVILITIIATNISMSEKALTLILYTCLLIRSGIF
ncbi:hypothetical protein S103564_0051 [Staphylococcus aureus subsp. aureus 103564]|nr:hypothetical protein S103564_0051 [Staphylococcus aureus subsp. aureus 103564]